MKNSIILTLSLSLLLIPPAAPLQAAAPEMIHHQGVVSVGGQPFIGTGQFKFALVNTAGDETYWSHDGSSIAGNEPSSSISLAVNDGLYAIALGDTTLANMSEPIPASIFAIHTDVRLRIWFDDGVNGLELLSPDLRLTSVGYALHAANAASATTVAPGAITANEIASETITEANVAAGGIHSLDAADGSPIDAVFVNDSGNVGIGTSNPGKPLHLHSATGNGPDILFTDADSGQVAGSNGVQIGMDANEHGFFWNYDAGKDTYFGAGGKEVMRLDASGNVGIGSSNPSEKLDVAGNVLASGIISRGAANPYALPNDSSNPYPGQGMYIRLQYSDEDFAAWGDKFRGGLMIDNVNTPGSNGRGFRGHFDRPGIIVRTPSDSCGHLIFATHDDPWAAEFNYNHFAGRFEWVKNKDDVRMTLTKEGNLGIGPFAQVTPPGLKSEPTQRLHVRGTVLVEDTNGGFGFEHTDGTISLRTYLGGSAGGAWIGTYSTNNLHFYTADSSPRMTISTNGNIGIGTTSPSEDLHVVGNILATGTITPMSDRNMKKNFDPVDAQDVLDRVTSLPLQQWTYKAEDDSVRHVGPMAQDFHAAFGLGANDTTIATVDADGVALAAIQGLNQKLERENTELRERLEKLEQLMNAALEGGAQ